MKNKKVLLVLTILIGLFSFWFFYLRTAEENRLTKEGELMVEKIENFRSVHHRLPNSLTEIGIVVIDESNPPLYFDKRDSVNYTVSFGISMDESRIYYSDTKKWEDSYRKMK
jgi:hypothetical protein